jgi:UDP-3-O-[3-hydroxymyristoyl] glucosamine N-acyltransferase
VVGLKPVTKGISVDNNVEITKGLEIGEEVVIKGQTLLNDGSKVNVVSSK